MVFIHPKYNIPLRHCTVLCMHCNVPTTTPMTFLCVATARRSPTPPLYVGVVSFHQDKLFQGILKKKKASTTKGRPHNWALQRPTASANYTTPNRCMSSFSVSTTKLERSSSLTVALLRPAAGLEHPIELHRVDLHSTCSHGVQ